MAAIPWMPLYVSDYLADTGHLGTIDHGAYFLMMMHYWTKGPLPIDDGQLRKIARMTPREWAGARSVLLDFFYEKNGAYHHKRIDAELATAAEMIEAKSKAGSAGASKRWQAHSSRILKQNSTPNSSDMAEALADECGRTAPLPSPSPSAIAEKVSPASRAKPARSKPLLNGHLKEFDEFWAVYPNRVDKADAQKAYVKALNRASPDQILAGAKAYAKSRAGQDKTFTRGPARWLNADSWLNELPLAAAAPANPALAEAMEAERRHRLEHGEIE